MPDDPPPILGYAGRPVRRRRRPFRVTPRLIAGTLLAVITFFLIVMFARSRV